MKINALKIDLSHKTKRIIARPLEERDFQDWLESELSRSPKLNEFDRGPERLEDLTVKAFKSMLTTYRKARSADKSYNFAVFEKKTAKVIGDFYIYSGMRWNIQTCVVGYGIHNKMWGQGFGKEALFAAAEIAFRKLKFYRLEAHIHPANRASIALAKSIGMRNEGRLKGFNEHNKKRVDNLVFAITATEWGIKSYRPVFGLSLKELV